MSSVRNAQHPMDTPVWVAAVPRVAACLTLTLCVHTC